MNYHDLAEVLSMLNQRLETASSARQVTEPWLNHIQENLGYVLLEKTELDRPNVISDLDIALNELYSDLRTGNVFPDTSRWNNVSNDIRQQSAYVQRMQKVIRELQSVIASQG